MITVSIGGKDIVVRPKYLIDYVEKIDFIKSRRATPWSLIQGFPRRIENDESKYKILVGLAMQTVYSQSSSVSVEEEICFDKSDEGFLWNLWKCVPAPPSKGKPEEFKAGFARVGALWDSATPEEKAQLKTAFLATDERHNRKKLRWPERKPDPAGQVNIAIQPKVPVDEVDGNRYKMMAVAITRNSGMTMADAMGLTLVEAYLALGANFRGR